MIALLKVAGDAAVEFFVQKWLAYKFNRKKGAHHVGAHSPDADPAEPITIERDATEGRR